jgi:hypothetical protein
MAEATQVLDTPRGVQGATTDKAVDGQTAEGQQPVPYLGTWQDRGTAEQGLANLTSQSQAHQSRADKAEALVNKLLDVQTQPQTQGLSQAEQEAARKEWIAEIDESLDGETLYNALVDTKSGAVAEAKAAMKEEYDKELASLRETVAALGGQIDSQNPARVAVQKEYDALKAKYPTLDDATALSLATDAKAAKGPDQPARAALPGSSGGAAIATDGGGDDMSDASFDAQEKRLGITISPARRAQVRKERSK